MEFTPPKSLETEHEMLRAALVPLTELPGKVGGAARLVAHRLHEHFALEEECAVPPLALLAPLAQGGVTPAMRSILAKTDRLKAELPRMLAEHRAIVEALVQLEKAGEEEHRPDAVQFAAKLRLHAAVEEESIRRRSWSESSSKALAQGERFKPWRASPAGARLRVRCLFDVITAHGRRVQSGPPEVARLLALAQRPGLASSAIVKVCERGGFV